MTLDLNNLPDIIKKQMPFDFTVPQTQPLTNNYLAKNRFNLFLPRCPNLTYFCQRANIPTISFGTSLQSNPTGVEIRRPGTRYAFEDLSLGFLVDENMKNWLELFNWMKDIGIYNTKEEITREKDKVSDVYLVITNSAYNPIISITYHDAFPVMLSGVDFDTSVVDTDPILASVTFAFTYYSIEIL